MESDRWRRVKEIYSEARARRGADREVFLADLCADDPMMVAEIRALLDEPAGTDHLLGLLGGPELALVEAFRNPAEPSLRAGQRLGIYEVHGLLGAGSMGEVYRARDTRLDRDVAIKMLPRALTADPDRLMRLEREARVLASLNHPNIGAIHGFDDGSGPALVLELVEGETLAERLAGGPLPIPAAIRVAGQIAEALEAAHAKGVVHRDLKPANIKITPQDVVKVLDFGIAKVVADHRVGTDIAAGGNDLSSSGTRAGSIVGTLDYMSPEQARGEAVDHRTDIWAFACVLYEMLSGHPPFPRKGFEETLAAIATQQPDWTALPAAAPPALRRLLRQCLEKDRGRRLEDIGRARVALENLGGAAGRWRFGPRAVTAAASLAALLAAAAWLFDRGAPPAPLTSPSQYEPLTNFTDSAVAPSLSPNGRMVTFIRGGDAFLSRGQVWVKQIPDGASIQLTFDSNVKYAPVFTPDGSHVAYSTVSTAGTSPSWDTWIVPVGGGRPALFLVNATGTTWIGDRRVLFAEKRPGTHMGIVTATETRADRREIYFPAHELGMAHYAYASPDQESMLVVEMDQTHEFAQQCRLLPFDGSSTGRQVGPPGRCTSAAWSPDGAWMYFGVSVRGTSHLWRQRFPNGTPEQLTFGPTDEEGIAVAADGRSIVTSLGLRRSAVWIRDGAGERALTSEGYAQLPRLSSDGARVYYVLQQDAASSRSELRVMDLASGRSETVIAGMSISDYDVSPDEKEVAFSAMDAGGELRTWLAPLGGGAAPREIARHADQISFAADGELLFRSLESERNSLIRIRRDGSGRQQLIAESVVHKYGATPDGQWVFVVALGGQHGGAVTLAVPVRGGARRNICSASCQATMSSDGKFLYLARGVTVASPARALAIPVPAGRTLPDLPEWGIGSIAQGLELPGALPIDHDSISPGVNPSTYVFTRVDPQRNLYRIPLN